MISVIIPIYNVEKYLNECVDSVINQTYRDIEIILVDDGSPDNCGKICDEYAKKDSRVRVIHKKNGGLSSARNAGIEIAKGEYFTFIDSDDYIAVDMLEQLLYGIEKLGADISVCKLTTQTDELGKGISRDFSLYTKEEALRLILTETTVTVTTAGPCKLYKRELFNGIRYPEGMLYEDLGTTYKLVNMSQKIAYVDVRKYYYRYNGESITKAKFANKQLDYFVIAKELQSFIKKEYPQLFKFALNHSVRISISFMRKISESGFDDKKTIAFLVSNIRKNIFRYIFSKYAVLSKMYGLLICISPEIALRVFKMKRK